MCIYTRVSQTCLVNVHLQPSSPHCISIYIKFYLLFCSLTSNPIRLEVVYVLVTVCKSSQTSANWHLVQNVVDCVWTFRIKMKACNKLGLFVQHNFCSSQMKFGSYMRTINFSFSWISYYFIHQHRCGSLWIEVCVQTFTWSNFSMTWEQKGKSSSFSPIHLKSVLPVK